MDNVISLLELAGTIVLVAVPIIVLSWALTGSDGPGLADIFAVPAGPPLPRGVQEGEPVRFRVERLSRPRAAAQQSDHPAVPARHGPAGHAVVESGPCA